MPCASRRAASASSARRRASRSTGSSMPARAADQHQRGHALRVAHGAGEREPCAHGIPEPVCPGVPCGFERRDEVVHAAVEVTTDGARLAHGATVPGQVGHERLELLREGTRHARKAAAAAGEPVQQHQRRTPAAALDVQPRPLTPANPAAGPRARPRAARRGRRCSRRDPPAPRSRAVHRRARARSAASNTAAESARTASQPRPRASSARSSPCGTANRRSNTARGALRATGRYSKMPPPSSLLTTTVRSEPCSRPASTPDRSCRNARSPHHSTVGTPSAAAAPSAADTWPSMPLTPRLASTRRRSRRGPAKESISRMAMLLAA